MSKSLTDKGIADAAKDLGVEPAAIRAVDEVESAGDGFTSDGRPKILFERHKFHAFTKGQYDKSHPDISAKKAGGYGKPGARQYARFSQAFALDPEAAMKSASWGRYQIMGFNHEAAGFATVGEFVDAMKISEDEQLKAFVKLIKSWGLAGELRAHDWASFARQYNGAAHKKNKYDTKMAAAYERFKRMPVDVTEKPADEDKGVPADESKPSGTMPPAKAEEVKASGTSLASRLTSISIPAGAAAVIGAIGGFVKGLPPYAWFAFAGIIIVAMIIGYLIRRDDRRAAHDRTLKLMDAAADQGKNNLRLI